MCPTANPQRPQEQHLHASFPISVLVAFVGHTSLTKGLFSVNSSLNVCYPNLVWFSLDISSNWHSRQPFLNNSLQILDDVILEILGDTVKISSTAFSSWLKIDADSWRTLLSLRGLTSLLQELVILQESSQDWDGSWSMNHKVQRNIELTLLLIDFLDFVTDISMCVLFSPSYLLIRLSLFQNKTKKQIWTMTSFCLEKLQSWQLADVLLHGSTEMLQWGSDCHRSS